MSRPYLNINSLTYNGNIDVLSMNYSYYKLRSTTPTSRTLTISGFSGSISFVQTHDNVDYSSGKTSDTITFSVATLGTSSTTLYSPAATTITFGGTPSATTTNVVFSLQNLQLVTATASGAVLSTYLTSIVNNMVFSATNSGFSATTNGTSITFVAPQFTGTINNGLAISMTAVKGGSGSTFTYSVAQAFSGGINTYEPVLSYSNLGGNSAVSTSLLSITGSII